MTSREIISHQEAQVCLEYLNGASMKQLSSTYGLSKYKIIGIIKRHGLPARASGGVRFIDEWHYHEIYQMYNYGKTISEICEDKNLRPKQVEKVIAIVKTDCKHYEYVSDHARDAEKRINDLGA